LKRKPYPSSIGERRYSLEGVSEPHPVDAVLALGLHFAPLPVDAFTAFTACVYVSVYV